MLLSIGSAEDLRALDDLHARYVHAIDRGDLDLLQGLYLPDAVEHHGDYSGGIDGFVTWLRPILGFFEIATHTISSLLVRTDGNIAESEARGTAFLRTKGERPFNMIVVNRHFDTYRKLDGRWLFASRSVCVDWAEQFAPSEAPLDVVRPFPAGTSACDDPVYRHVPGLVEAIRRGLPQGGEV
ncbi:nuclear transport factor 2 family protein [Novosphingobium beihaiensis]|uniref:Nuclear transport factor 2 family protein n=1 Tax=Novosphingobium beihaiensis TaxID=2930389 RepID=A0ABT0BVJ3_9SPHN|nr:nuclear transport factor 2 family protein [Novosphingobium beihaiensis]MCJ2189102.1 nuclear transport factor 2 family protein [Novosphingobium beihaiensis]